MIYNVPTRYEELCLNVTVRTTSPEKIRLVVKDSEKKHTVFTNRWKTVNGDATFFVRMPVSGKIATIEVYNEKLGMALGDKTYEVVNIERTPLEKKMDVVDFRNPMIKSFVGFATRFCFNAGDLPAANYKSDDGNFLIEYLPQIVGDNGKPLTTPARINQNTGHIQVSKAKFVAMTVPMRMAILLHEFSHYYVNDNMRNETEADLNALLIYLGLGYPRIEAHEAFLSTFVNAPSEQNKQRYDKINKFIADFEKNNYIVYE